MNFFLDTNVIIAALHRAHPFHSRALPILNSIIEGQHFGFMSAHSLLELQSVLTTLPRSMALSPYTVQELVNANIYPYFTLLTLSTQGYKDLQHWVTELNLSGEIIYDALQIACAQQTQLDKIYTYDLKHFTQITPETMQKLLCEP